MDPFTSHLCHQIWVFRFLAPIERAVDVTVVLLDYIGGDTWFAPGPGHRDGVDVTPACVAYE